MSARASRYEQVATNENGVAPPRRPWSGRGNLTKMFVALVVVVVVYSAFTLTREDSEAEASLQASSEDYWNSYLNPPPTAEERSFRDEIRVALRMSSDTAFQKLSAGTGKVDATKFARIVPAIMHAGVGDAISEAARGLPSNSVATSFFDSLAQGAERMNFSFPLTTQRAFAAMDVNSDGVIEFEEFNVGSQSPTVVFSVFADHGTTITPASALPIVLELTSMLLDALQQAAAVLLFAVDAQADAIAGAVWTNGNEKEETLPINMLVDVLTSPLIGKFNEMDALVKAGQMQPWGLPNDTFSHESADFSQALQSVPHDQVVVGISFPAFVEFMLRNSTLPDHAWASNPVFMAALASAAQAGGVPLPPLPTDLLTRIQTTFLEQARVAGSYYYQVADVVDKNVDGFIDNYEFNSFLDVFVPLQLSWAEVGTLDRVSASLEALLKLWCEAYDEYEESEMYEGDAGLYQSDFSSGMVTWARLVTQGWNMAISVIEALAVIPIAEGVMSLGIGMIYTDHDGTVSSAEFAAVVQATGA